MSSLAKIVEVSKSNSAQIKRNFRANIGVNGCESIIEVILTSNHQVVAEFIDGFLSIKKGKKRLSLAVNFHSKDALATIQLLYGDKCLVYRLWDSGMFQEQLPEVLQAVFKNPGTEIVYRAGEENDGILDGITCLKNAYQGLKFANTKRVQKGVITDLKDLIDNQEASVIKKTRNWTDEILPENNVLLAVLNVYKTSRLE